MRTTKDKVILKVLDSSTDLNKTKGGIFLPEGATDNDITKTMEVVTYGSSISSVRKGDKVIIYKMGSQKVNIDGEEYEIVLEGDILVIL